MDGLPLFVLIIMLLISIIPVIDLATNRSLKKFFDLSVFFIMVFVWGFLILLAALMPSGVIAYGAHMIIYIIVSVIAIFLVRSIYAFLDQKVPKHFNKAVMIYLTVHGLITITNHWHESFLQLPKGIDSIALGTSAIGWFYMIHVIVAYGIIGFGIVKLMKSYRRHRLKTGQIQWVTLFLIAIVIIILLNMIHVFIMPFTLDPTYYGVVFVSFIVYWLMYKRNFLRMLGVEGRNAIIKSMREHYVLCDEDNRIIEISPGFLDAYHIPNQPHTFHEFFHNLKKTAIIYEDYQEILDKSQAKPYLYMKDKPFAIKRLNIQARLYLFYDESAYINALYEMEYLKNHDTLTGLNNRNYLETMKPLWSEKLNVALIASDIDKLKTINDTYGHAAGDELLIAYANKLKHFCEGLKNVHIIRTGGDEFLIVLEDDAFVHHDRLETMIEDISITVSHQTAKASVGKAIKQGKEPFENALKRADERLYKVKRNR